MILKEKFAIAGYPEPYEKFGQTTQLKQVPGIRMPMKLYEAVKKTSEWIRLDHCTFWTDGEKHFLLSEFCGVSNLQLHPDFVTIPVPPEFSPYHQSRKKGPKDTCTETSLLIGYADTKPTLDEIKQDLDLAMRFSGVVRRGRR